MTRSPRSDRRHSGRLEQLRKRRGRRRARAAPARRARLADRARAEPPRGHDELAIEDQLHLGPLLDPALGEARRDADRPLARAVRPRTGVRGRVGVEHDLDARDRARLNLADDRAPRAAPSGASESGGADRRGGRDGPPADRPSGPGLSRGARPVGSCGPRPPRGSARRGRCAARPAAAPRPSIGRDASHKPNGNPQTNRGWRLGDSLGNRGRTPMRRRSSSRA